MAAKRDIHQEITDTIVAQIEGGAKGADWRMPWHRKAGETGFGQLPLSVNSGKPYKGLNVILLWVTAIKHGYERPIWGTYKSWEAKGGMVRKGEKGTQIFVWDRYVDKKHAKEHPQDEPKYNFFLGSHHLFNIAQLAKIPAGFEDEGPQIVYNQGERIAACEAFFAKLPGPVVHGGGEACHIPALNQINMPDFERFFTPEDYYATLSHEYTHWTRVKARLDRNTESYAMEELVAELGAAFLCAHLGIANEPRPDHAQYLAHWLEKLTSDKKAIFQAAKMAQAAVDYLLNLVDASGKASELPIAA